MTRKGEGPGSHAPLKRSLRRLKAVERKIRFGSAEPPRGAPLVWDAFFCLHEAGDGDARYPLRLLAAMDGAMFQHVVDEFFFSVYERFYRENGIVDMPVYDPGLLSRLGLPMDADAVAVKKRFHELAMLHHPDRGGDAAAFIRLMQDYRRLVEKGR